MMRNQVILLVDDSVNDVELTLMAFEESRIDHNIVVAGDGEEALDYLFATGKHTGRDPAKTPEVVLLDLKLPKVDGHDILKRMRADPRTRRIPVVVMTSSSWEQDVIRSYDLGANSFIQKPVNFSAFLDTARQIGQYWLGLNQIPSTRGDSEE
jgi:two-component system response regulator